MKNIIYSPDSEEFSIRLDQFLAKSVPNHSRSYWQKLCDRRQVLVNDKVSPGNKKLTSGDRITIHLPKVKIEPVEVPIIYEDENVIVFNKPSGILTHSKGSFNEEFTVADRMKPIVNDDDTNRPGIVHRLDRDTSGVIICAKNQETKKYLQKQFSSRKVFKEYVALAQGRLEHRKGSIKWPIERNPKKPQTFRVGMNGKNAETQYELIGTSGDGNISFIKLTPKTGRTHQLRVHLAHLGHPIIGDRVYAKNQKEPRLFLHASKLSINITGSGDKTFEAKIPPDFKKRLKDEL